MEKYIMLTIITPCCRPENLQHLFKSINFTYVNRWLIAHDVTKTNGVFTGVFNHPKITEFGVSGGISGNPQRNAALDQVKSGLIYFLDDDNIIHPNFWELVPQMNEDHFYTFDQLRMDMFANKPGGIMGGEEPRLRKIDTAQYVVPAYMCGVWKEELYWADGLFIEEIYEKYKEKHVYIPRLASYYNFLEERRTVCYINYDVNLNPAK